MIIRVLLIAAGVVLLLTVVSLVDVLGSPRGTVRILPRWAWGGLVLILPVLGAVLWWTMGRPWGRAAAAPAEAAGPGPGSAGGAGTPAGAGGPGRKPPAGPFASDPDRFLQGLSPEERIQRLEEELSRLDHEDEEDRRRRDGGDARDAG
ncbi:MAG: PLDc N-terminal domain-containing protein [Pseudoclavibacter sp.]